jgi:hypothetical protein
MKKSVLLLACVFAVGIEAAVPASEIVTERVYKCTENRFIWNYRVAVYESYHTQGDTRTYLGTYATLSEYNIFTQRERFLRSIPHVSRAEASLPVVGAPETWTASNFALSVYPTVYTESGVYGEFEGLSHRGKALRLQMTCE